MVPGMEKRLPVLDSLRELLKVPRVAPSHNSHFQADLEPEFVQTCPHLNLFQTTPSLSVIMTQ